MRVLILGAAGMVGKKLVGQLCEIGQLCGREVTAMTLFDVVEADKPTADWPVSIATGDIADRAQIEPLIRHRPDVIFHLASIVSGEAETDFDKGYRINLHGAMALFDVIHRQGYHPKVVFTSSIAVFGAPLPDVIEDEFLSAPLTSYGTQKACIELLLTDYTRKGIFEGTSIRLPSIVIRPGKPNKAASSFFSGILREPLVGQEAILPVPRDTKHWIASPRAAARFLIHAANLDRDVVGDRRALTMPGIGVTVGEMIDALVRVAGPERARLIREQPDEMVATIVSGWPRHFDACRALALGFRADDSVDEIIRLHIEHELGGSLV